MSILGTKFWQNERNPQRDTKLLYMSMNKRTCYSTLSKADTRQVQLNH